MRELKFRAWVNDHWTDFLPICKTLGEYNASIIDTDGYTYEIDNPFIVEQYTGLKDKDGKEIYEGDIIQCHLSPISSTIFTGVVEFRPGCIMFKNFADSGAYAFNSLGAIEAVIGNIHENPELLGRRKNDTSTQKD